MAETTFDPDKYLQATDPGPGFNPEQYLAETDQRPGANIVPQTIMAAQPIVEPVAKFGGEVVKGAVQDIGNLGRVATQITPAGAGNLIAETIAHPIKMTKDLASAYVQGHPTYSKIVDTNLAQAGRGLLQGAKNLPGAVASGILSPESMFAAPYQMAAYEQEKIRENPNAPEYKSTPYAQMYRGEFPTQGAAGAYNRRQAIANQQYGGLTPEQQQMLAEDRKRREAQAVLQQPPTTQNFMERMRALGTLYKPQ